MIVSQRKRFIFVHIYKTGGSSLTRILGPYADVDKTDGRRTDEGCGWQPTWHWHGIQHDKIKYRIGDMKSMGMDLEKFRIVTVVRHPCEWILSIYNEFYRDAEQWHGKRLREVYPEGRFIDFLHLMQGERAAGHEVLWGSTTQLSFIENEVKSCDILCRFESYDRDVRRACWQLGIPALFVPHLNKKRPGEASNWRTYFADRELAIVRDLFWDDFKYFSYTI